MVDKVQELLAKLLVPNQQEIQEATESLRQILLDPAAVPAICTVVAQAQDPAVRQIAAVVLRKRIAQRKQWDSLPPAVQDNIRQNILEVMIHESVSVTRSSIVQVVGTVARHDVPEEKWPKLMEFLQHYTISNNPQEREAGMLVLKTVCEMAPDAFRCHLLSLLDLCNKALADKENPMVPYYSVLTLNSLVVLVDSDQVRQFQNMIPKVVAVTKQFSTSDETKTCEMMDIFDELAECELSIIVPHIKGLVEYALELGANRELDNSVRVKALSIISTLARLKKKSFVKLKLVEPLLRILFGILCEGVSDEEAEEEFEEAEAHTACSYAAQVIDTLALHLPPEKFIPLLMEQVTPALGSPEVNHRRAAYLALAVTTEGCADHIRTKHLKKLIGHVKQGIQDPSPIVRDSVTFALGQFSEHLQPDISKYAQEVLPLIFQYLNALTQNSNTDNKSLTKTYYALEMFCENMGKDIVPYLPDLMQFLLSTMTSSPSFRARELAISSVAAIASAAGKELVQYFHQIMNCLKDFLQPTEDESALKLQTQAIDTLGVFARSMGEETFGPLAKECVDLGLRLLENAEDPDLKRCIYGMFASVSTLMKAEMAPYLETMVKTMLLAVKSAQGISLAVSEEESKVFNLFNTEPEDTDDDDEEDIKGFSVENAFLDEKEDACEALGELAVNVGVPFQAYIPECYAEITKLVEHPAAEVRKGATVALARLCIAVDAISKETDNAELASGLKTMLDATLPLMMKKVKEDEDRTCVIAILDILNEMLQHIGAPVLQGQVTLEQLMLLVRDVMKQKIACQDQSDDEGDEEEQAEFDSILIENAGDIIPAVTKVVGGSVFAPYLAGFLPDLLKKLKSKSSVSDKSFALGVLAETVDAMGQDASNFVQHLYPYFSSLVKDEDEEVRSNSIYGLGVLCANGGEAMTKHYTSVLDALSTALYNSKSDYPREVDNICAAVCRMIIANAECVPLDQVVPVVIKCLPLKEDVEEYKTVLTCMDLLYSSGQAQIISSLPEIVNACGVAFGNEEVPKETQALMADFVKKVNTHNPAEFQKTLSQASPEVIQKLQAVLVS